MTARRPLELDSTAVAYSVGGLLPIAVGGLLVSVRGELVTANLALIMVLTVVVAAVLGGRGPGAFAAVIAALSFDFFLTIPYLRLTIESADDIETTLILLVVGVIVGQVAVGARRAQRAAARGSDEITRIHRVGEVVASGADAAGVEQSVRTELTALLDLRECRFESPPGETPLPHLERSGAVTGVQTHRFVGDDFALPAQGVALSVLGRGHQLGRLVMVPAPGHGASLEERVVAVALADQLGAVLVAERAASSPGEEA